MKKRYLIIVFLLVSSLMGCSFSPKVMMEIDWVDFIQLNGNHYLSTKHVLEKSSVGPEIAKIRFQVADNVLDPHYEAKNGDAAFLEAGTSVYKVNGYKENFRIAIIHEDKLRIYEAYDSHTGHIASDYLDLENKVDSILIKDSEDNHIIKQITSKETIDKIAASIMSSPIRRDVHSDGERYFVTLHFKDGTESSLAYWPQTGKLGASLLVTSDFRSMVDVPNS